MFLGSKIFSKQLTPPISRCASIDEHVHRQTDTQGENVEQKRTLGTIGKSLSLDTGHLENENPRKNCPLKRLIKRRAHLKRCDTAKDLFGHNAADYDVIRERVLQERAVTNAIEALQERGRMLKYMYDDCVHLNEGRQKRKQNALCMKRQKELIGVFALFFTFCIFFVIPVYVGMISNGLRSI